MQKAALISVSDKTGLVEFAQELQKLGYLILSTSGTGKYLSENGVKVESIEEYTGQAEILGGRVKTLHPRIHAGLLARTDNPQDLEQLKAQEIYPIEIAIVNLYPFAAGLESERKGDPLKMVELVDIGGPTMIRAAAKNFRHVVPLIDPSDYSVVLESLKQSEISQELRRELAVKVFKQLADYNLMIARYFSDVSFEGSEQGAFSDSPFASVDGVVLEQQQQLRYGENPHQKASYFRSVGCSESGWSQLNGKELSYNNFLDFTAALRIVRTADADKPFAVIMKHLNPCGAAYSDDLLTALKDAKKGDPRSHFGGIIGFNQEVTAEVAEEIGSDFAEIVLAPAYDVSALELLKKKKNLRVIEVDLSDTQTTELRSVEGGYLIQELDRQVSDLREARVVSERKPTTEELEDLQFAWMLCSHVKSNAITLAKDRVLLSSGAGQMSRIDAAEVALMKASTHSHDLTGSVAASDAFFPFPDTLEALAAKGVSAIVAPGGARKDQEVIEAANSCGISLLFVEDRHFRH